MSDPLSKAATAAEIARAVSTGKVKASAVVEAALARIKAAEPTVNAFTDIVAERAKKRAAEIDAGQHIGPMTGVPFAVKNLFDIAGLPTRAGSKINADGPAARRPRLPARLGSPSRQPARVARGNSGATH